MKEFNVEGIIYAVDEFNFKYAVCYIKQVHYEDETFKYVFKPFYNMMDLLNPSFFQGIPGLNLELKKDEYIRENKTPTFIYERTPQENREDLWDLLEEVNLKYLDKLEWLIRTDRIYTGDRLVVERFKEPQIKCEVTDLVYRDQVIIDSINELGKSTIEITKNLLMIITSGAYLKSSNFVLNDENRANLYSIIYTLYQVELEKLNEGSKEAKSKIAHRGRKKINVPIPKLGEVIDKMEANEMTTKEAMKILGLNSRSTLYRRIRDFKENQS